MFRRTFIGLATTSSLALAGFGLIGRSKAKLNDGVEIGSYIDSQSIQMRNELINYFEAYAYRPIQPLPLVTGVEFNGGLEFDDDTSQIGSDEYCIQASARVDDIDEMSRPGGLLCLCPGREG